MSKDGGSLIQTFAMVLVAAWGVGAGPAKVRHRRGCRSVACDRRVDRLWTARHRRRDPVAFASWYEDAGSTACGSHYRLGFASLSLPCGARVRFCSSACATGVMEDRGPYVAGRSFDLNPGLRAALGCGGVCRVRWRRVR